MKIVVFSGAGVSKESGIETFRDTDNGLWYEYKIEDVADNRGWKKNPQVVMDFHNFLRQGLLDKEPNGAHLSLAELEKEHEVIIITQNVGNLHEKAGFGNVLHLHGELFKSRADEPIEWGTESDETVEYFECLGDLNVGDTVDVDGEEVQLRPHTVLFGEMPFNINKAYAAIRECDILIVVGTSLPIRYTHHMLSVVNKEARVYYIDPSPVDDIDYLGPTYIKKGAVEGMKDFVDNYLNQEAE